MSKTENNLNAKYAKEISYINKFKSKNVKTYPCGKNSLLDSLYSTKLIKNIDGDTLYESKGSIKRVVEKAVKDEINLSKAILTRTELSGADLKKANLKWAKLNEANLNGVNFEKAELWEANFEMAELKKAIFKGANLFQANLTRANLEGADLEEANVFGVDLTKIRNYKETIGTIKNLDKAKNVDPKVLADWKKAKTKNAAITKAIESKKREK